MYHPKRRVENIFTSCSVKALDKGPDAFRARVSHNLRRRLSECRRRTGIFRINATGHSRSLTWRWPWSGFRKQVQWQQTPHMCSGRRRRRRRRRRERTLATLHRQGLPAVILGNGKLWKSTFVRQTDHLAIAVEHQCFIRKLARNSENRASQMYRDTQAR